MRENKKLITSVAEAIGTLIINGFYVNYDENEYGTDLYAIKNKKTINLHNIIELNDEFINITVSDFIKKVNNEFDELITFCKECKKIIKSK